MDDIFKKLALIGDVWVLWILVAASIGSLGVIIERWWTFRKNRVHFGKFLAELIQRLETEDMAGACQWARSFSGVESRVALAGLSKVAKGPVPVEDAMAATLIMERAHLEKNLTILGTLGNNAPFIGLFGTVLGIIKAFNDLAVSGSGGVSVVMAGISSALIATAFGIFVAIPAVAANNYFQTRLRRIVANGQSLIHIIQVHVPAQVHAPMHVPMPVRDGVHHPTESIGQAERVLS